MTSELLLERLRKWPAQSPEGELRELSAEAQFAILWPLAVASQSQVPSSPAAALLLRLNPPCPMGCSDAVAGVLPSWDISIEEVPWYLVKQFGRTAVVAAAETLARTRSGVEKTMLETVVYWAGLSSHKGVSPLLTLEDIWRRYDAIESRLTAPLSERMLDLCGLQQGMHVLDLATGRGEPALRAAARVGSQGSVLGVDLSGAMLRMAREAADRDGLTNLDLREGNAESLDDIPRNHFHAATVRWGLMYMKEPVAALSSARRGLVSAGALVAALWTEPERASFFTMPRRLLERYRSLPALDPEAPGMFRYADHERVVRDFNRAGFTLDHVEDMEVPIFEAETGGEVAAWVRALGSGMGQLLNELPENEQRAWEQDVTAEVERTRTGGVIRMGGVTRLVRARPI